MHYIALYHNVIEKSLNFIIIFINFIIYNVGF